MSSSPDDTVRRSRKEGDDRGELLCTSVSCLGSAPGLLAGSRVPPQNSKSSDTIAARMDYDRTSLPQGYDRARSRSPAVMRRWMSEVQRHVAHGSSPDLILDLGCGTGRFSGALLDSFPSRVIGLDPSASMLSQAAEKHTGSVELVRGSASALPLESGVVDLLFISMVLHHLTNREAALAECARVLSRDGVLFLRTGTSDAAEAYPVGEFFPASVPLMQRLLPTRDAIRSSFRAAGLRIVHHGAVEQEIAPNLAEYHAQLVAGGDSVLARLSPSDLEAGLQCVRRESERGRVAPVTESIDVFVFARS